MKPTTFSVLLFAGMTIQVAAHADEEATKETKPTIQSVDVVVQSSSLKEGDSAPKTAVKGRIVILGPDGKRQEYELSKTLPVPGDADDAAQATSIDQHEPRYLIGVVCEPADELLRRHLKLADRGLLASQVSDGLPAATAGILQGDILLAVQKQQLKSVQDLINVVSASEGTEITIELLRDGDRISVAVTPKKLTGEELREILAPLTFLKQQGAGSSSEGIAGILSQIEDMTGGKETPRMFLRSLGPGIRLETSDGPQQEQQLLDLINSMVKKQDSEAAEANVEVEFDTDSLSDHKELSLKVLRQQVEQLRQQIDQIQKQIENMEVEKTPTSQRCHDAQQQLVFTRVYIPRWDMRG